MADESQTTAAGSYPKDIENPDEWAAFLARYLDNRATNAVHNGIGLVALHITDAIRNAGSMNEARDDALGRHKAFVKHLRQCLDGSPDDASIKPSGLRKIMEDYGV